MSKLTVSYTQSSIKDKGKGIMIEPERPLKRKDQIAADKEHQEVKVIEMEMQDIGTRTTTKGMCKWNPLMHWLYKTMLCLFKMNWDMTRIAVLEFEVKDKSNVVTRLTNQLDETLKEKEDLKAKLEQFETSSKNLSKLINCQLSTKDKTSLGYEDQLSESNSEVPTSVFDGRSSDGDDNQANDRFKKGNEYHEVPPPLTGNYMPPLADLSFTGLDDSVYRPTANKTSASTSQDDANVT
ncbi:hypothetical protein Tco_1003782 [Tanacetum coccineum]|uniref:Uncharacterized protein n=1 Tax=Tanacetum coccineum TaxID=301880 RepID=A0ABQ5FB12_9ASTR